MTDKELEKQEKKILREKQDSDMEWVVAALVSLLIMAFIAI